MFGIKVHFTIKGATFEIRFSHKDSNSLFHAKKSMQFYLKYCRLSRLNLTLILTSLLLSNALKKTKIKKRRPEMALLEKFNKNRMFFKNWPIPASFGLFSFFSRYNFNTNWKKDRWCAWDSNPGSQDERCRWNHRAMAATQKQNVTILLLLYKHGSSLPWMGWSFALPL